MVYTSLVVNLIGQQSPDVISRLSVSREVRLCLEFMYHCAETIYDWLHLVSSAKDSRMKISVTKFCPCYVAKTIETDRASYLNRV